MKTPILSIFAFGTLGIWAVPFVPLLLGFAVLLVSDLAILKISAAIASLVVVIPALIIVFVWAFDWYLICAGVMFGKADRAHEKLTRIQIRLERLAQ